tara:strand:+ start:1966 stop:2166 length:201 start_codon:yes stop_codon:yes gene_type:complete
MDKLNELLIGVLAVIGGFVTKRIFNNHDTLSNRISALEKVMLTKEDISSLERNMEMVVEHLINLKK